MRSLNHTTIKTLIGFLLFPLVLSPSYSQELLPELKASIDLVNESWKILDETADKVWPEWRNYKEISYFTAVPLKQDLLINPPSDPEDGFISISTKLDPIMVYLREPGKREKVWGGAYRYEINGKRYKGVQFHVPSEGYSKKVFNQFIDFYSYTDSNKIKNLYYSDNFFKSIIIHEAFHLWQFKTAKFKAINETHESSFSPNESYQRLANKEGEILAEAFLCNQPEKLKELTKSFLETRKERRKLLTNANIKWEKRNEYVEGCAMYIETKVFELIDEDYWETLKIVRHYQIKNSPKLFKDENQATQRCYFWGMVQACILDKLYGSEWKKEILKEGVYFENLLADIIK